MKAFTIAIATATIIVVAVALVGIFIFREAALVVADIFLNALEP